jgi:hypothetical protein
LVTVKTISSCVSEYNETEIRVNVVKMDQEILSVEIPTSPNSRHCQVLTRGENERMITQAIGSMMLKAQEMVRDFPDFVRRDIESGLFNKTLREY